MHQPVKGPYLILDGPDFVDDSTHIVKMLEMTLIFIH